MSQSYSSLHIFLVLIATFFVTYSNPTVDKISIISPKNPSAPIAYGLSKLYGTNTTKYWMEQMGLPFHPTHINKQNQHDRRHGYADMLKRVPA